MGREVLGVVRTEPGDPFVRVYAHCAREAAPGSVAFLAINLHRDRDASFAFPRGAGRDVEIYQVTAASLDAREVRLNGEPMKASGAPLVFTPRRALFEGTITLPPLSYSFFVVKAGVRGCVPPPLPL